MNNIDFSHVYKFFVSVGLGIIVFAFVLPWLLLREKFDLYLKEDDLSKLTEESRKVIQLKTSSLIKLFEFLPYIIAILFLVGITLIGVGVIFWWRKQQKDDHSQELGQKLANEKQQLENEKLKRELPSRNPQEKVSTILEGSNEMNTNEPVDENTELTDGSEIPADQPYVPDPSAAGSNLQSQSTSFLVTYRRIEQTIINKFQTKYQDQYEILLDRKISDVEYDVLLLSKKSTKPDVILDLKYCPKRTLSAGEVTSQLDALEQVYSLATGRKVIPLLVLVVSENVKKSAARKLEELINKNKVLIITDEELSAWSPDIDQLT